MDAVPPLNPSDIYRPDILSAPWDFYRALRENAPVARATDPSGRDIYLVTSYALIEECSKRLEDFSSDFGHLLFAEGHNAQVSAMLAADNMPPAILLVTDDPAHKRYRSLVNAVFSMGRIANMAGVIARVVDDLIDDFIEKGECDFVNEFAILLPTYVIADILGLPRDQYAKVREWSDALIAIVSRMHTPEQEVAAAGLVLEFRRYIRETIAARRAKAEEDLISYLVNVRIEGMEPLRDDEIAPLTFEIAIAGNETTRNMLMSGITRLLKNPDQLAALREDSSLTQNAVEEMLRFETPASSIWRIAAHDTELGGVFIPKGAQVLLRLDSGNRDDEKFPDAARFDIRRPNARLHQSFGGGTVHRCLGQMLSRKELNIAFPKILARLQNLHIIPEASNTGYWPGLLHRGIFALRLGFTPGEKVNS